MILRRRRYEDEDRENRNERLHRRIRELESQLANHRHVGDKVVVVTELWE